MACKPGKKLSGIIASLHGGNNGMAEESNGDNSLLGQLFKSDIKEDLKHEQMDVSDEKRLESPDECNLTGDGPINDDPLNNICNESTEFSLSAQSTAAIITAQKETADEVSSTVGWIGIVL